MGKLSISGVSQNSAAREAIRVAFDYLKANMGRVSTGAKIGEHDFHLHVVELHGNGSSSGLTLSAVLALTSGLLGKPLQGQLVTLGEMSLGGSIVAVNGLAETLQNTLDAGAKRALMPMTSVTDIPLVPGELFAKLQISFFADPIDAIFKSLGVE